MLAHRVRAAVLSGFNEVARFVGLDPLEQLKRSDIRPDELSNQDHWIAAQSVADLLERCSNESGRSDFSLLLAECRTFSSLGPVSLLLKHEASLSGIVQQLDRFKRHLNDVFALHLEESGDVTSIHWTVPPAYGQPQVILLVVAMGYRALTDAMNGAWIPERVHIPLDRPDQAQTFERFFASPIEFNSTFAGFSFPTTELKRRNPWADSHMAQHAVSLLEMMPAPPEQIVDRTQHAVLLLLPVGKATLENVARNLGVHPRALQRQLNRGGRTFAGLLDETRRSLATLYLRSPGRTVSEVADLVGYSSVSSFTRWFTDQLGVSPSNWRRNRLVDAKTLDLRTGCRDSSNGWGQ